MAWDLDAFRIPASFPVGGPMGAILPDGSLLGVQYGEGEDKLTRFDVVLNFRTEVKHRMRAAWN